MKQPDSPTEAARPQTPGETTQTTSKAAECAQAKDIAEAMAQVIKEVVGTLDVAQVTDRIVSTVVRFFGARRAVLFRVDSTSGSLECVAIAGAGDRGKWLGQKLAPGEGVAGRALVEGRPIRTGARLDYPGIVLPPWLRERLREDGLGAMLAVPLRAQGSTVGVLSLVGRAGLELTDQELSTLTRFTDMAALALANARFHDEQAARLRVTEALLDIAQATGSTLALKSVLSIVAQRAAQAIGGTRCSIHLWRDGRLVPLMSQFADGHVDPALWAKYRAMGAHRLEDMPLTSEAIRTKKPVVITDIVTSEFLDDRWREVYRSFGCRAALIVPMIRQGTIVGTLGVDQTDGPCAWTSSQVDLAMTIANHAALVVENARLYGQLERRVLRMQTLTQLNRIISASLDRDHMLQEIAQAALQLMDARLAVLWVANEAERTLEVRAFTDPELLATYPNRVMAFGEGVVGQIAMDRQPFHTTDLQADPRLKAGAWLRENGFRSAYALPILHDSALLGVLSILKVEPFEPSEEDRSLLEAFVAQAAVAIRNASLYAAETDARRQAEMALAEVRQLEGLLPICSYCKKVRNDENYWEQLEGYISARSQARFSHGICPECQPAVAEQLAKWKVAHPSRPGVRSPEGH